MDGPSNAINGFSLIFHFFAVNFDHMWSKLNAINDELMNHQFEKRQRVLSFVIVSLTSQSNVKFSRGKRYFAQQKIFCCASFVSDIVS